MTHTETATPTSIAHLIVDDLDYISSKPVRVPHVGRVGVVQSAYRISGQITVDVRFPDGSVIGDLGAFGEYADVKQVDDTTAYEAYRRDIALDARWMVWPSCDECDNGPSKPCRRTCSYIARIYHTR
jgi:hypothetical protein